MDQVTELWTQDVVDCALRNEGVHAGVMDVVREVPCTTPVSVAQQAPLETGVRSAHIEWRIPVVEHVAADAARWDQCTHQPWIEPIQPSSERRQVARTVVVVRLFGHFPDRSRGGALRFIRARGPGGMTKLFIKYPI